MTDLAFNLFALLLAYLLGSIPSGYLLARLIGQGDIRNKGSGNTGATNLLRMGSVPAAAATLALDLAKGWLAVYLVVQFFPGYLGPAALLAAVVGHCYPVWLDFSGGKGVATALGALLALAPWLAFAAALVWILVAAISRISSLASILAMVALPFLAWSFEPNATTRALVATALLIVWRHRSNLQRLFSGTESKIGERSS